MKKTESHAPSEAEAFIPTIDSPPVGEKDTTPQSGLTMDVSTQEGRFVVWGALSMTAFEKKVWRFIGKGDNPWRFLPQFPFQGYVLDFYSETFMIAIEADGPTHLESIEEDTARDDKLLLAGIRTLRLRPIDFIQHTPQTLFDLIEEFAHPRHLIDEEEE